MKKIVLVPNTKTKENTEYSILIAKKFLSRGCMVVRDEKYDLPDTDGVSVLPQDELYRGAELIVILGGDGSILETSRLAMRFDIPMLGINLGRLGYMAELERDEFDYLDRIFENNFKIEERMTMKIELISGDSLKCIYDGALNDAVASHGEYAKMIEVRLCVDGKDVSSYRSDAIIFSTPTGSTAYSMAAGGAVLDPTLECISVTPVCPQSLFSKSIVFSSNSVFELENIDERNGDVYLTIDGSECGKMKLGEKIRVSRSDKKAKMILLKPNGFFGVLNKKTAEFRLKN